VRHLRVGGDVAGLGPRVAGSPHTAAQVAASAGLVSVPLLLVHLIRGRVESAAQGGARSAVNGRGRRQVAAAAARGGASAVRPRPRRGARRQRRHGQLLPPPGQGRVCGEAASSDAADEETRGRGGGVRRDVAASGRGGRG
jgi:hypothetical protein